MRKHVVLALMILLVTASLARAEEYVFDRILVKVNDGIILESDLSVKMKDVEKRYQEQGQEITQEMRQTIRSKLLEKMVEELLLELEAQRYGITVEDQDVDEEIARIKAERNLTDEQLAEILANDGFTLAQFRERIRESIKKQRIVGHMVHDKVLVTDTELKEEYEKNMDKYSTGKTLDISVIVLPPDVASKEVVKRIDDEEMTFAEAADKYSVGPGAGDGGKVNGVMRRALADEWQKALEGLEPGEMTDPMLIGGKETIILLRSVNEGDVTPFEEVKDDIMKRLMAERRKQVFDEYFQKLHDKAVIEYMDQ